MFSKIKYDLREKIISSTKEGNAEISGTIDALQTSLDSLTQSINTLKKDVAKMASEINQLKNEADFSGTEFVSNEYLPLSHDSKKKRLLVCGFYGAKNLGDELMLQSLLSRLDKTKYDITIMVARHKENDMSCYSPFKVIHYPQKNDDILNIVHNYDLLVWGGGAILDDSEYGFNGAKTPLGYIFMKSSIAMICAKKPVYVLGVSTNQHFKDATFIDDLSFVVKHATYFSLRDTNSKNTLKEAGIDISKVSIIDDLTISAIPVKVVERKKSSSELHIGIILINSWDNVDKFASFLKNLASAAPDKKIVIHFIPFYDYIDLDINGYKKIADLAGINHVIEKNPKNIDELADELLSCEIIFSMRYHGSLIASLLNIKTISIDISKGHPHYYNKVNYIKECYNDTLTSISFEDLTKPGKVKDVLDEVQGLKKTSDSKKIISSASKKLDDLINKLF